MSCHDIGRGANHMVNCLFKKYDEGKVDVATTRDLIRSAIGIVWYCDGNDYEAYETAGSCRCGCCLRKMQKGEKLYWMDYCIEKNLRDKGVHLENYTEKYAYDIFCEDCVRNIFPESVINDVMENECEIEIVNETWENQVKRY